jgi:pimeloyl-ACP methyl ester carboxylesterase
MKFEKPILMGHSMGAATVMRVGAQYPNIARAVIMLDPGVGRPGTGRPAGAPPAARAPGQAPTATAPVGSPQPARPRSGAAPAPGSFSMFGTPEALATQNNQSFEDFVARCGRQNSKWDPVDCQYWALSKLQYHGPYTVPQSQAMQGTMATGDSLARITAPAIILKADAPPETRKVHQEAASVLQKGKLVHIDGAAHNLHHDQRRRTVEELTAFLNTL